ncbi:hypothetical protein B0H17DRAFT_1032199 [Mycena rosella]|uniref:Pyridoxamine 5'-phosphate oxidase N-terminal domain-containing protein n=1 Tax=Mycena rosella TaxID=1033263 RepID=A0AAD7GZ38_MYCRO|nr:hypothetical protein B0H17DRAFT_1032199 [Mycena rosella]
MVQFFDEISPSLAKWMNQQQVFWVATAPLSGDGHINLSPKGGEGMFHIVDPRQVWYEDLTGSGVETISHLRENGRITVLFNAFEGPPRIARLYGRGTVYEYGTPEYNTFVPAESRKPGSRSVILIDVHKVSTSCGYAVPFFDFKAHRTRLLAWATKKESIDVASADAHGSSEGLVGYWNKANLKSLDGLTGLVTAPFTTETFPVQNTAYKTDNEKTGRGLMGAVGPTKFLLGFSLGILVASAYMRMSQQSYF